MGARVQRERVPGLPLLPLPSTAALFIPLTLFLGAFCPHPITLRPTSAQDTASCLHQLGHQERAGRPFSLHSPPAAPQAALLMEPLLVC